MCAPTVQAAGSGCDATYPGNDEPSDNAEGYNPFE